MVQKGSRVAVGEGHKPLQLARSSQQQCQAGQTGPKLKPMDEELQVGRSHNLGQDTVTQVELQEGVSFTASRGNKPEVSSHEQSQQRRGD